MELVFCEDCKFIRSCSDCFGGVGYSCRKAKRVRTTNGPISLITHVESPEDKNKNNDCRSYVKSKWWEKIWANTNG